MKSLSTAAIDKIKKDSGLDLRKPLTADAMNQIATHLAAEGYNTKIINSVLNQSQQQAAQAQGEDEHAAAQAAQQTADKEALKALPKDLRQLVKSGATTLEDAVKVSNNTDLNAWRASLSPAIKEGIAAGIVSEGEVWRSQKGTDMPDESKAQSFAEAAAAIAAGMGVK